MPYKKTRSHERNIVKNRKGGNRRGVDSSNFIVAVINRTNRGGCIRDSLKIDINCRVNRGRNKKTLDSMGYMTRVEINESNRDIGIKSLESIEKT